jgi:hypothetical protein
MPTADELLLNTAITQTSAQLRNTRERLLTSTRQLETATAQLEALSVLVISLEQARDLARGLPSQLYLTWYDSGPNRRVGSAVNNLDRTVDNVRDALQLASDELRRVYVEVVEQQIFVANLVGREASLASQLTDLRSQETVTAAPTSTPTATFTGSSTGPR